jgi:hypothetical protein
VRRGIDALPLHPFRKTLPTSAKKLLIVFQGLPMTLTDRFQ